MLTQYTQTPCRMKRAWCPGQAAWRTLSHSQIRVSRRAHLTPSLMTFVGPAQRMHMSLLVLASVLYPWRLTRRGKARGRRLFVSIFSECDWRCMRIPRTCTTFALCAWARHVMVRVTTSSHSFQPLGLLPSWVRMSHVSTRSTTSQVSYGVLVPSYIPCTR